MSTFHCHMFNFDDSYTNFKFMKGVDIFVEDNKAIDTQ